MEIERRLTSEKQIDLEINRVFNAAKDGASIESLKREFSSLLSGFHVTAYCFPKGKRFFRSVAIENLSENIDKNRLKYPPLQRAKLGRANEDGNPVFYCANEFSAAVFEIQPVEGQCLAVGYWASKEKFLFQYIGITKNSLNELGSVNNTMQEIADFHNKKITKNSDLDAYLFGSLSRFFIKPGRDSVYKFTSALTSILLEKVKQNPAEKFLPEYTKIAGIQYPSVMCNGNAMNFAITTETVDNCLDLLSADFFQFSGGKLHFIKNAIYLESQEFNWKHEKNSIPFFMQH